MEHVGAVFGDSLRQALFGAAWRGAGERARRLKSAWSLTQGGVLMQKSAFTLWIVPLIRTNLHVKEPADKIAICRSLRVSEKA